MASTTSSTIESLNSLLRGELAATETYQQAMAQVGNESGALELRQIRDDHRDSANLLRQHVHQHGGQPDQDSGAWGVFAKAVEGSATLAGNAAALRALKAGEENGLSTYEGILKDGSLPADCEEIVRTRLLPQTRAHIATLDRLMAGK